MIPKRIATLREFHAVVLLGVGTVRRIRGSVSVSDVQTTIGQMATDLRSLMHVGFLRMFGLTVLVSFVMLYGTVFAYDMLLEPALFTITGISLFEVVPIEGELILFGLVTVIPIINGARLLFVARISGRNPAELFRTRSLFEWRGVELAILVLLVPFLSRELFQATGVPSVIDSLASSINNMTFLDGPAGGEFVSDAAVERSKELAMAATVLYLYPSILLVYLSHSKLSKLYPFTQFVSIARSWNYLLLVATTVPVVVALNLYIVDVIGSVTDPDVQLLWVFVGDVEFMSVFVVLTTVTVLFVFTRLGTIAVADAKIRTIFADEVDKQVQLTLNDFS